MLLSRSPQPKMTAAALVPLTSVVLLTGYCQLWAGDAVSVVQSVSWAAWTVASWALFMLIFWLQRARVFQRLEKSHTWEIAAASLLVFVMVLCVALASYFLSRIVFGYPFALGSFERWFISRLPLLIVSALAVTAVAAATCWRRAAMHTSVDAPKPPYGPSGNQWLELPEAPLLRLRKSDVAVIRTARNYCELEVAGRSILVRVTAKQLEGRLAPLGFVRVHRGAIVNLSRVRMVQRARSGCLRLLLDDGSEIGVSKGHRNAFAQRLSATTRMPFQEDWAA